MNWIFSLQKSISKLIFVGYTGSKNQVRNTVKLRAVDWSTIQFLIILGVLLTKTYYYPRPATARDFMVE